MWRVPLLKASVWPVVNRCLFEQVDPKTWIWRVLDIKVLLLRLIKSKRRPRSRETLYRPIFRPTIFNLHLARNLIGHRGIPEQSSEVLIEENEKSSEFGRDSVRKCKSSIRFPEKSRYDADYQSRLRVYILSETRTIPSFAVYCAFYLPILRILNDCPCLWCAGDCRGRIYITVLCGVKWFRSKKESWILFHNETKASAKSTREKYWVW